MSLAPISFRSVSICLRLIVGALAVAVIVAVSAQADTARPAASRGLSALPHNEQDAQQLQRIVGMSTRDLKRFIGDRDANCDGCIERRHLLERALEVRGWLTGNERVAAQLTPLQVSAATHLQLHHIADSGSGSGSAAVVLGEAERRQQQQQQQVEMRRALDAQLRIASAMETGAITCTAPLANGTRYCMQVGASE